MNSFNETSDVTPTFNNATCEQYFNDILCEHNPLRLFERPDWMPVIDVPTTPFIHSSHPPDYYDGSRII